MTPAEESPSPPSERALQRAVLVLLEQRDVGATICPSEVARELGGQEWRQLMGPVRTAARALVAVGEVEITQRGQAVDPTEFKGPIRIRRVHGPDGRPTRATASDADE